MHVKNHPSKSKPILSSKDISSESDDEKINNAKKTAKLVSSYIHKKKSFEE